MNLGGGGEVGKDGRTDWTNGTQGAHIKSLEEDQKEKEFLLRATQNNNKITSNILRAALQHLIPSWSTTPSTYDLLETTHTHTGLIFVFVHVHLPAMEKWGRRRRLSSAQEPTQT